MKESNHDTYCGLYCGACDILRSHEKGQESKFAYLWTKPTLKAHLNAQGVTYDEEKDLQLKCQGCKSDDVFIVCRICKIRECAISKNIEHCSDCEDYPCQIYNEWNKLQVFLPHITAVKGNLETINKDGAEKWLSDQKKQWECPECGKAFSWYSTKCDSCGTDLSEHSFKFSKWKILVMKSVLRLSSLKKNK